MKIAVTGATGNIGVAVVSALAEEPDVHQVVGIARRRPFLDVDGVQWVAADVSRDDLAAAFAGVDAVVHLAWLVQPSRSEATTWRVNVEGSTRVFRAAADAGARAVIHASSVGAYSPGPKDRAVDESWPTDGVITSAFSRQKAYVERVLDTFDAAHPDIRVVRLRPGFVLQRAAGNEIRRHYLGPFVPASIVRRRLIAVVPRLDRLRFQVVHTLDAADAFRRAVLRDVRGAFNVAAEPVLDPDELGRVLGARPVPVPTGPIRLLTELAWRLRLQPTDPGWLDLLLGVPIIDTRRARDELGWSPLRTSAEAFVELLDGIRDGAGHGTPPLQASQGPEDRLEWLATGVGSRDQVG